MSICNRHRVHVVAGVTIAALLTAWGDKATSALDKYSVAVPDGLAFSEFRGFESWPAVAVSQTGATIEVILGNPEMITAYLAGDHGVGKHFPDGAKLVKIHWNAKQSDEAPAPTTIPGALQNIDFMARDSKRFADSGGWGYAEFDYDTGSKSFAPMGTGHKCGLACHTIVKSKDYVFTAYGAR